MNGPQRTVLVVDDEAPARDRLSRIVEEIEGWRCAGSCGSGAEALDVVSIQRPDVVVLDIEMPGLGGLEVARRLADLDYPPAVIFATAYDQFALDAFESRAVGYVLKPVRRERLETALAHAARLTDALADKQTSETSEPDRLAIKVRDEVRFVSIADVSYFRADQKYTTVYHKDGDDLIEASLKELEGSHPARFVRIHRSILVAVSAVDRLERGPDGHWHVWLKGRSDSLPVSRRQISELKSRLAGQH